jgi:hypothetical protein
MLMPLDTPEKRRIRFPEKPCPAAHKRGRKSGGKSFPDIPAPFRGELGRSG